MTAYQWHADNLTTAVQDLHPHWQHAFTSQSSRIVTDSRKVQTGDIFLALKGDNFDGHDYVQTAYDKGAIAAIVSQAQLCDVPQLVVDDTRLALGQLGAYRRRQHPDLTVVAITGSSGKTTVKEMLGSILSHIAPTRITRGNLNNDLGVPMMLLEIEDTDRYAVLELGANHLGEIAYTTALVQPQVAGVLNIGTAHLGEFGGRDNIARGKSEIYQGLAATGTAVLPADDDYSAALRQAASAHTERVLAFGGAASADTNNAQVFVKDTQVSQYGSAFTLQFAAPLPTGQAQVALNFAGQHNIHNALAAATCAAALGIDIDTIAAGLNAAAPAKGRLNIHQHGKHTIIDDTYNANPDAVLAATAVLAQQAGNKILVLGDIGELGDDAPGEHTKLGTALAATAIDRVLAVGDLMAHTVTAANAARTGDNAQVFATHFHTKDDLVVSLNKMLADAPSSVLCKGSRFMQMEQVVDALLAANFITA